MEIRRATATDARGISVVHVESHQAAYKGLVPDEHLASITVEKREAAWKHWLESGETTVFVAEEGGQIVGWVALGPSRDAGASPRTGEVWAMYVAPDSWNQGIGRSLWDAARDHLVATAHEDVTLWCLQDNDRALSFYRATGFSEDGETKSVQRGGKDMVDVRLRLKLPAPAV